MKLVILKLVTLSFLLLAVFSIDSSDQIIGKWQNPDKNRQIEIFKKGDLYYGKIHWLKDTKDIKVKKGDIVMKDIKFSDEKWIGKIKVPARDSDFDMEITMPDKDKLNIKASYGIMSRIKVWTRIK